MQPPATLPELVEQLGRTQSPFERLKILGRAWVLLRKMTPQQRATVAAQLGLDRADELVEAIAKWSGTQASPALLSMIDQAQKKGRAHLPELLADLRDPVRRAERVRQGVSVLAENVVPSEPPLPPAAIAAPAPVPPSAAPPPSSPPGEAQIPKGAPAPPAPQPMAVPAPQPAAAPSVAAVPPAPQLKPAASPPPQRARTAETRPMPLPKAGDGGLAGRLSTVPRLGARFHVLRRHLKATRGLPAEGWLAVVEAFPDGWARRRVLLALFRAGVPGALQDALALLETLGATRDRVWCVGALLDSRKLDAAERSALLAAVPSAPARTRLERRIVEE